MNAVFQALNPQNYRPHPLHDMERAWPETNCYVDLWIEILATLGLPPEAAFGFTVAQDFEGDQFTFFKIPAEDLESLYGVKTQELAIFDDVGGHILAQIARGRLCLVEMDSFFLPDTRGLTYGIEHGKTTVGINRLDAAAKRMDYFHNGGYFALEGADFDGIFQTSTSKDAPFLPYTEFGKFDGLIRHADLKQRSLNLLAHHLQRRPAQNPIAAFAKVFPEQARGLLAKPEGFFHKYAFNTLRQFGANFSLLAAHLQWLAGQGELGLDQAITAANRISDVAKSTQFQLARALARQKFEPLTAQIAPASESWDELMVLLDQRFRA